MSRTDVLDGLRRHPEVTVLIVGGGINGAGLFRELALQGVDVLLIDKGDFSSGATSAPSRMIHGGLRYLENGEFRLVRESLQERNRLLENAPHYVKPLPTTIPIFDWFSGIWLAPARFLNLSHKPTNRGALLIKMGLWLYDFFTRSSRLMPRHHFSSRKAALAARPQINPEIACTATYYDAWISYPERLCLELIKDGEQSHAGAQAVNYLSFQGGAHDTVQLCDELTGEIFTIKPRVVVNAAGAWIDLINQSLDIKQTFIGGTKGSHLIIDHPQLLEAMQGEMLYYENVDNRVCIMFPLFGKVLAGSTDIRVNHPDEAITTEGDIDYILESIRQVFPAIAIDRSHVVFHFCGVRPLPSQDAASTGQISRDHSCEVLPPSDKITFPIYSLIGGKWTTFRAFAEQVTDRLLNDLHLSRRTSSVNVPIGGGRSFPSQPQETDAWLKRLQQATGLSRLRLQTLLTRYGTHAEQVAAFLCEAADSPLLSPQAANPERYYTRREMEYLARTERVCHLDDLVLRRTTLALLGELTMPLLHEIAHICADVLGWTSQETETEIERTQHLLHKHHGVSLISNKERVN